MLNPFCILRSRAWRTVLLVATFTTLQCIGRAIDVTWEPQSPMLGFASAEGTAFYNLDVRDIDFGDGLRIPLRFVFESGATEPNRTLSSGLPDGDAFRQMRHLSGRSHGWVGWSCSILEACIAQVREDQYKVLYPNGRIGYMQQSAVDEEGNPLPEGESRFYSQHMRWEGEIDGDQITMTRWDGWRVVFRQGRIESMRTDKGRTFHWERLGPENKTSRIYEPATSTTILDVTYGGDGRVAAIQVNGDAYALTFDGSGTTSRLVRIAHPDGDADAFAYPSTPFPGMSHTNHFAVGTTLTWDPANRYAIKSDGPWNYVITHGEQPEWAGEQGQIYSLPVMEMTRSATGENIKLQTQEGNTTQTFTAIDGTKVIRYSYEGHGPVNGKLYKIVQNQGGTNSILYRADYDAANGRVLRTFDALGRATLYAYEIHPGAHMFAPTKKITVTNPAGEISETEFDTEGRRIRVTNAAGVVRRIERDTRGRPIRIYNDADVLVRELTYNNFDRVLTDTRIESGVSRIWTYTYAEHLGDSLLTRISSPEGAVTEYDYSARGNFVAFRRGGGEWTLARNADTQRIETITDPLNAQTALEYDARGNLSGITDPLNHAVDVGYDDLDMPNLLRDALGAEAHLAWNADRSWKTVDDFRNKRYTAKHDHAAAWIGEAANPNARVTEPAVRSGSYMREQDGLELEFAFPDGAKDTRAFDPNRDIAQWQARGGQATATYQRDAAGRIAQIDWNHLGRSGTLTFGYTNAQLTSANAQSAGVTVAQAFTYDAEGRLASLTQNGRSAQLTYWADGLLKEIVYPSGMQVTYLYDGDGNIAEIKKDGATLATYDYDTHGRRTLRTLANGLSTSYAYDTMSRLTDQALAASGGTLREWHYGFDAAGNRSWTVYGAMTNAIGDAYRHDAMGQITGVKYDAANATAGYDAAQAAQGETFTYDNAGNRIQSTFNGQATAYTVDDLNRYIALSGGMSATLSYNARGDLLGWNAWSYAHNAWGHIIEASKTSTGETIRYHYDAFGQRAGKTLGAGAPVWYLNFEDDLIEEYDTATQHPVSYIFEPGIDRPVARVDHTSGTVVFYHADWLGSTVALSDASGNLVEEYRYEVFGSATILDASRAPIADSAFGNRFLFTGREWDAETGLYHYRARAYCGDLGRFSQYDNIRFRGGDLNLDRYVFNRVDTDGDPTGEFAPLAGAGVGALGGFVWGLTEELLDPDPGICWGNVGKATLVGGVIGMTGGMCGWGLAVGEAVGMGAIGGAVDAGLQHAGNIPVPF